MSAFTLGLSAIAISTVGAQAIRADVSAPVAPFADPDSTRNVAGHVTFDTYDTPGMCIAAVDSESFGYQYDGISDTLPSWQRLDTIPSTAQAIGASCGARFTVSTTPVQELFNLFVLSDLLGDSVRAIAARDRWLASAPALADHNLSHAEVQAERLTAVLDIYLAHIRTKRQSDQKFAAHLHQAQILLQRLDALDASVQSWQLLAHAAVLDSMLVQLDAAGQWNPQQVIQTDLAQLPRFDAASSAKDGMWIPLLQAILARGFLDPHGVVHFVDSLRAVSPTADSEAKIHDFQSPILPGIAAWLARAGTPTPALTGSYSYNTQGAAVWPRPGHLSLLVRCDVENIDFSLLWALRRLNTEYGARGLDITLVAETNGYWLKNGTKTGPVSTAQEAALDSALYLGDLKLPVALVVQERPFGVVINRFGSNAQPDPWVETFGSNTDIVLSDQTGHLIVSNRSLDDRLGEIRLRAYIDRALKP